MNESEDKETKPTLKKRIKKMMKLLRRAEELRAEIESDIGSDVLEMLTKPINHKALIQVDNLQLRLMSSAIDRIGTEPVNSSELKPHNWPSDSSYFATDLYKEAVKRPEIGITRKENVNHYYRKEGTEGIPAERYLDPLSKPTIDYAINKIGVEPVRAAQLMPDNWNSGINRFGRELAPIISMLPEIRVKMKSNTSYYFRPEAE